MPVANVVGQADNLLIDGQHPFWNGFQASGTPVGRISSSVRRASNILPLDIAGLAEGCAKRGNLGRGINYRVAAEKCDHRHRRLLRTPRDWPRNGRATGQRNELPPPHPSGKDGSKSLDAAVPRSDHGASLSVVFYTVQRKGWRACRDDCQWAAPTGAFSRVPSWHRMTGCGTSRLFAALR